MRLAFLAGTILVLTTACGGGPATNTAPPTAGAPSTPAGVTTPAAGGGGNPGANWVSCDDGVVGSQVTIVDNGFEPATIAADADDTVNWTNTGSASHTVTFDNGQDCGTLANGETLTVLFLAPGAYPYHCTIHPSMTGTATVS